MQELGSLTANPTQHQGFVDGACQERATCSCCIASEHDHQQPVNRSIPELRQQSKVMLGNKVPPQPSIGGLRKPGARTCCFCGVSHSLGAELRGDKPFDSTG